MDESGIRLFYEQKTTYEIQVIVLAETVWLSQKQMEDLFEKDKL